jgi:small nuclear ribonucleoprotein (snRNP)-like protein
MKELSKMIGNNVVVETIGKKETFGILTSVETLTNGIYGNSYLISIDKEIVIPMHSIYKITLMDRYERDKKEDREKKKSEVGLDSPPHPFGMQQITL